MNERETSEGKRAMRTRVSRGAASRVGRMRGSTAGIASIPRTRAPSSVFLAHDVWDALWFADPATGQVHFGIGVGTLVLTTNVVLLSGYTFGCHSLRHLVGGGLDVLSGRPVRAQLWNCVTCFNKRHMLWAWMSLFGVALSDVYVRLCSMGILTDFRLF